MSEPIKTRWDVKVEIHSTIDLGVALKLKLPKGIEVPAFLSPAQARDAAQRLITAAEEVESRMSEPTREQLEAVLRKIVAAHKVILAGVTPGHPQSKLRDHAGYDRTFSGWHSATDEAAALIGWKHRQEVVDEAGTKNGIM